MSRVAALVLAAVFAWSGLAKLVRRPDMTRLGLPASTPLVLAAVELALVVALVVSPTVGGIAALTLLAGFTAFLLARRGSGTGCGCFGSASTKPVSSIDIARNGALLLVAALASFG